MWLIATTITPFIAKVRVMAGEYSVTVLRRHPIHSRPVTQLFKWRTLILIIAKQSHNIFRKFTYSNRSELTGKTLQRKPRHHQECASFQVKYAALLTDRGQTYIGLTKWQWDIWCAVSGNFLRRKLRYTWERTLVSTNTAFDYWMIASSPDCESVCGATCGLKAWITKE